MSLGVMDSQDRSFMVNPLSYFSIQPVLHDWCNKVCGMYCLLALSLLARWHTYIHLKHDGPPQSPSSVLSVFFLVVNIRDLLLLI